MAEGHGWGGASCAVPTTLRWLPPALPSLIQGGEHFPVLMSLCIDRMRLGKKLGIRIDERNETLPLSWGIRHQNDVGIRHGFPWLVCDGAFRAVVPAGFTALTNQPLVPAWVLPSAC